MNLTVYHLKTCDTCKKAIKSLQASGHQLELVDVRADRMQHETLFSIVNTVGYDALLNKASTTWRALPDHAKMDMTPEKAIELMRDHPTLIKRPVIISGDRITVGWKTDAQACWN